MREGKMTKGGLNERPKSERPPVPPTQRNLNLKATTNDKSTEENDIYGLLNDFMTDLQYKTPIKLIDDILEDEIYYKGIVSGYYRKELNKQNFKIVSATIDFDEEVLLIRVLKY